MAANNALKRINARVKVLQKKHPKSKRKTLQKQAGREWRTGKLKNSVGAARKKHVAKRKPAKRKKAVGAVFSKRKRSAPSQKRYMHIHQTKHKKSVGTSKRRKHRTKYKVTHKVRRISGAGKKSMLPIVIGLAALAAGVYFITRPSVPALNASNNPARVQAQSNILGWAAAAGIVGSALASIIKALNDSDDSTVVNAGTSPSAAQAFLNSQMGD